MENTESTKVYSFEEARSYAESYLNSKDIPYSDLPDNICWADRLRDNMQEHEIKEICDGVYEEALEFFAFCIFIGADINK